MSWPKVYLQRRRLTCYSDCAHIYNPSLSDSVMFNYIKSRLVCPTVGATLVTDALRKMPNTFSEHLCNQHLFEAHLVCDAWADTDLKQHKPIVMFGNLQTHLDVAMTQQEIGYAGAILGVVMFDCNGAELICAIPGKRRQNVKF